VKIYVASSWRNTTQPRVVEALRGLGHEVYDYRNPAPGNIGFGWSRIDQNWKNWSPAEYRAALQHPLSVEGYAHDIRALRACELCVLVLPSGRSASWEFGYAMGQGKRGIVFQSEAVEPELMYREAEIVTTMNELVAAIPPMAWNPSLARTIAARCADDLEADGQLPHEQHVLRAALECVPEVFDTRENCVGFFLGVLGHVPDELAETPGATS
jgi:hypothetical protein